uniref:Uncharacterized protein n=1 Tax=Pithovirus LCDPAC01 TaxID=2506600 RepID=A0A481YMN9_9VIRU|nr:MAG: hypothetical protein LCDPAC01_00760 [Pithovirus LCDPAC01]
MLQSLLKIVGESLIDKVAKEIFKDVLPEILPRNICRVDEETLCGREIIILKGELIGEYKHIFGTQKIECEEFGTPALRINNEISEALNIPKVILNIILEYLNEDVSMPKLNITILPYTMIPVPYNPGNEIKVPYTNSTSVQHRKLFNLWSSDTINETETIYLYELGPVIIRIKFIEYRATNNKGYCYVHKTSHMKYDTSIVIPLTELTDKFLYFCSEKHVSFSECKYLGTNPKDILKMPETPHVYMSCYHGSDDSSYNLLDMKHPNSNGVLLSIENAYNDTNLFYENIRSIKKICTSDHRGIGLEKSVDYIFLGSKQPQNFRIICLNA